MSVSTIEFLLSRNRPREAERAAREELSKNPENLELRFLLAVSLIEQAKPKQAEEVLRDVIAQDPDFDSAYALLARCLSDRSRNKEALNAIRTAISIDPDDANHHGVEASILAELDKHADALRSAETGLALDPDNDTCRFYRSILLGKAGRHDEADSEAVSLLADEPDDATSHCARGWVQHLAGNPVGAEQHFIEALRIDPGHEDARLGLAEALKMGNPLLGWLMRGLLWIGRVPWYYLLVGIVAANMVGKFLRQLENPVPSLVGQGLLGVLMTLFILILVHIPLFNLALASSKKGRLALSDDETAGLKWALLPLLAGFIYLTLWWLNGLKSLPFLAIACFSVASLAAEVMESTRTQVRRALTVVAITAAATATYLILFAHFWLPGMVADLLGETLAASSNKETPSEAERERITQAVEKLLALRRTYLDFPTLALFLVAGFRDEIREFFERRSSDATG